MTLVLVGKGPCFEGLTFKNRGHLGSRQILGRPTVEVGINGQDDHPTGV